MTSPVAMSAQPQAMEMTAPVAMSPGMAETMAFVLPFKQYPTVATAPVPTNQHVSLREKPGGIFAVLQAHGPSRSVPRLDKEPEKYSMILGDRLGEHSDFARTLKVKEGAPPQVLGYNAPTDRFQ